MSFSIRHFTLCTLLALAAAVTAQATDRGVDHASVFVVSNYQRGKTCTGGHLAAVERITAPPAESDIKAGIDLKRFPIGRHTLRFRYTRLVTEEGACVEQIDDSQLVDVELETRAGKHYELKFNENLEVVDTEMDERPIQMSDASAISALTHSWMLFTASCIDLFPNNKGSYVAAFRSSAFADYADVFGYSLIEGGFLNQARIDALLAANGDELLRLCNVDSETSVDNFNYLYGPYVEDVRAFFIAQLESNANEPAVSPEAESKPANSTVVGKGARTRDEIGRTMASNQGYLFRVFNRQLRVDPSFGGVYHFRITIDEAGDVSDCETTDGGEQDAEFAAKICAVIADFDFGEKPGSGTRAYVYPISFN